MISCTLNCLYDDETDTRSGEQFVLVQPSNRMDKDKPSPSSPARLEVQWRNSQQNWGWAGVCASHVSLLAFRGGRQGPFCSSRNYVPFRRVTDKRMVSCKRLE